MTNQIWLDEYKQWNIESTITLPDEQTSLLDLWDNSFNKFQQRKAFIFADQSFSYAEIDLYSRQVATFLQSLGLKRYTSCRNDAQYYSVPNYFTCRDSCGLYSGQY